MFKKYALIFSLLILNGCASHPADSEEFLPYTEEQFSEPLNVELSVNTGDSIYVQGTYIKGEMVRIPRTIDLMLPGSMFIPFPVQIKAGFIGLSKIDAQWKYFCAPEGNASASFPGLGSVIARGDCVGMKISHDGTRKYWMVDNSIHNRMNTVWEMGLSSEEEMQYVPVQTKVPFKIKHIKRITFDGYYGKQLHFTYEELSESTNERREFTFDFDNNPTEIGIKGAVFTVLSASNVNLVYKWTKLQ